MTVGTRENVQAQIESIELELEDRAEWLSATLLTDSCERCGYPREDRERACKRCGAPRCVGRGS